MTSGVPGFVPRILSDPTVGLFRADERVFDAMLDGCVTAISQRATIVADR